MKNFSRGSVLILALVFGGIFFAVFTALAGYLLSIDRAQDFVYQKAEALSTAEAGLALERSHLENNPLDTSTPNPSTVSYQNIEGTTVGTYTIAVVPHTECGESTAFDLSSTGIPSDAPSISTTISLRYVEPSGTYSLAPDCVPLSASSTAPQFLDWQER